MARPRRRDVRGLASLPPGLRDELGPEGRRAVADLAAELDRRHGPRLRIGLLGGADCPPFLAGPEAEAPGAARLYVALDGYRSTRAGAVAAGTYVQLEPADVDAALAALRRAELVSGSAPFVTLPPGNVPF